MAGQIHPILQAFIQGQREKDLEDQREFEQGLAEQTLDLRRKEAKRQARLTDIRYEEFLDKKTETNVQRALDMLGAGSKNEVNIPQGTQFGNLADPAFIQNLVANSYSEQKRREIENKVNEANQLIPTEVNKAAALRPGKRSDFEFEQEIRQSDRKELQSQANIDYNAREMVKFGNRAKLQQDRLDFQKNLKDTEDKKNSMDMYDAVTAYNTGELPRDTLSTRQRSDISRFAVNHGIPLVRKGDLETLQQTASSVASVIGRLDSFYAKHGDKMGKAFPLLISKTESPFIGFIAGGPDMSDYVDQQGRFKGLAIQLWTAVTGEKGRFSETDQKAADRMLFNHASSLEINRRNSRLVIETTLNKAMNIRFGKFKAPMRQAIFDNTGLDFLRAAPPSSFSFSSLERDLNKGQKSEALSRIEEKYGGYK